MREVDPIPDIERLREAILDEIRVQHSIDDRPIDVLDGEVFWQDQAEQRVVWDLLANLEKVVTNSFSDTYVNAVRTARRNVRVA